MWIQHGVTSRSIFVIDEPDDWDGRWCPGLIVGRKNDKQNPVGLIVSEKNHRYSVLWSSASRKLTIDDIAEIGIRFSGDLYPSPSPSVWQHTVQSHKESRIEFGNALHDTIKCFVIKPRVQNDDVKVEFPGD